MDWILNATGGAFEYAGIAIGLGISVAVLEYRRRSTYRARRRGNHIAIKFGHDSASCKAAVAILLMLTNAERTLA
jgi:hypothetical protein